MTLHATHVAAARDLLCGRPVPVALVRPARLLLDGKAAQLRRLRRWPEGARGQYAALAAWAAGEVER